MKVLFCRFGGLGEQAITESFVRLGHQVECANVKSENYDYDKELLNLILRRLEEVNPDCVFSINFLPIVSKVCQIYNTLYISWVYDSPELHLYSSAIRNPVNRVFLFDYMQFERFRSCSQENIFHMPLATSPMSRQEMEGITPEEHAIYDCDISFIGSLYNEKSKRFHELLNLPDYWRGWVEGIAEAQLNVFGYNFIADSLDHTAVKELKRLLQYELVADYHCDDREVLADMYIGPLVSALDRERTMKAVAQKHRVTLYTDSDTANLINIENRGPADSITMMPKIFHCSKINLNITAKTIQTGIPLRVFDVLGCRGFLITNYQAELSELFEPGKDFVVYEDLKDLEEKITYYLAHDEERKQIAENGYQKVCENYTYDIVLREILDGAAAYTEGAV